MNLHADWNSGPAIAERYRREADTARLLALAPRRRAGRPVVARALRTLAQRLARAAERLEPTPATPAARATEAWNGRAGTARPAH